MSDLYDTDIVLWSEQQADLLRRLAAMRSNEPSLDWEHIIEEIEGVGIGEVHAVESLLLQAILHDLKAIAWPSMQPLEHWRAEARSFRAQAALRFAPSMRQRIDVVKLYARAARAMPDTVEGQPPLPVPGSIAMTIDDLLNQPVGEQ